MSWKKWLKRILLGIVLSVVARTVWLVGEREWVRSEGERELAAALAATDAADPDWRWEAIAKNRQFPPPGQNSADLIPRIKALLPPDWFDFENPKKLDLPEQLPNQRLPKDTLAEAREHLGLAREAVELARTLKNMPNGNRVINLAPDVFSTILKDTQDTRAVILLLQWDTILAVADKDQSRAADDLVALLNASRSIGDEPFLISQLVRVATRNVATRSLEWVLGQIELPEARLAVLQAAWAKDAEEPLLLYGLRGDRAAYDVLLKNLSDGTITSPGSVNGQSDPGTWFDEYAWWLYRGRFPHEREFFHRWTTQMVESARLPVHEQAIALQATPSPGKDLKFARLLLPAAGKVASAHWRCTAEARCVALALACERFRIRKGKWPEKLADLPKDVLEAVPLDPYDGQPLRYRRLADGIANAVKAYREGR